MTKRRPTSSPHRTAQQRTAAQRTAAQRTAAQRTGPKRTPPQRPLGRRRAGLSLPVVVAFGVVAVVAGVVAAIATTRPEASPNAAPADMKHIHALVVDPADGMLYAGTHKGVFRIAVSGEVTRVGQSQQDMMGFTAAGPGRFLGSGHPAPDQGGPAHLGLIESTDTARTWRSRSLPGEADFHSLRYRHDTAYGHNSTTGQLMVSKDLATWESRSELALYSFVVSPDDPGLLLAATPEGLARSADGGRRWARAADLPLVQLDWPQADRLWAVGATGEVYLSPDGGTTWDRHGKVAGQPAALISYEGTLYVALVDGSILRSTDSAATWTVMHR